MPQQQYILPEELTLETRTYRILYLYYLKRGKKEKMELLVSLLISLLSPMHVLRFGKKKVDSAEKIEIKKKRNPGY